MLAPHQVMPGRRTRTLRERDADHGALHQPARRCPVVCADELGPVIPRTFAPAPGWSPDGHRIKAELDYSRGPEKTWVYGALRLADGHEVNHDRSIPQQRPLLCHHTTVSPPEVGWKTTLASGCPHFDRCLLAQPARRLVADLPQSRPGRPVLRRPRRNRPRHQCDDSRAERPCKTLGMGQTHPTNPPTTPPVCVRPLRNAALASTATVLAVTDGQAGRPVDVIRIFLIVEG